MKKIVRHHVPLEGVTWCGNGRLTRVSSKGDSISDVGDSHLWERMLVQV